MKRSQLGPGKRSLDRGSTFASRGGGLARTTPLERKRPAPANKHLAELERRLEWLFRDSAQRPTCPICHEKAIYLHAHHCIEEQTLICELEALVTPERMIGIRFDVRNALGTCERCHGGHHGPSLRSPFLRRHLRPAAFEFARELDALTGTEKFTVRLEAYPDYESEAA